MRTPRRPPPQPGDAADAAPGALSAPDAAFAASGGRPGCADGLPVRGSGGYGGPMASPVDPVVADLRAALPQDRVVTEADVVRSYVHDQAEWAEHGTPRAVVRPLETKEVAAA